MEKGEEKVYKLIKVRVNFSDPFLTIDFTGKLVKTMLINSNPELQDVFEGKKKVYPKPLRITTLLKENDEAIYPKVVVKGFAKSLKPKNPPSTIQIKGNYYFYVGYESSLNVDVHKALVKLFSGLNFNYGQFNVRVKAIGMEEVEVSFPSTFSEVKVKLVTPSVFKDPFEKLSDLDKIKVKRFLPFPPFMFSTNVYEIFRDTYKRNIIRLAYSLIETHNNLNTITKVWYYYDGNWLPGVIGYAKFFVRKNIRKEVMEALRKILEHANVIGIGTSRATGFGFCKVSVN